MRAGRLSTEEAEQHPHRSVITRAIGTEPSVEVETLTISATPGDLFLICSDGLTDMVRDDEIAELILTAGREPDAAAEALVDAANHAGGIDNITVVLFEVMEGEPSQIVEPAASPEPDEDTLEQAREAPAIDATAPVRRHGAGSGGRWLALGAIALTVVAGLLLVWWSIRR
jgi:protein phosphatase